MIFDTEVFKKLYKKGAVRVRLILVVRAPAYKVQVESQPDTLGILFTDHWYRDLANNSAIQNESPNIEIDFFITVVCKSCFGWSLLQLYKLKWNLWNWRIFFYINKPLYYPCSALYNKQGNETLSKNINKNLFFRLRKPWPRMSSFLLGKKLYSTKNLV